MTWNMNGIRKAGLELWRSVGVPFLPRLEGVQAQLRDCRRQKCRYAQITSVFLWTPPLPLHPEYMCLYKSQIRKNQVHHCLRFESRIYWQKCLLCLLANLCKYLQCLISAFFFYLFSVSTFTKEMRIAVIDINCLGSNMCVPFWLITMGK